MTTKYKVTETGEVVDSVSHVCECDGCGEVYNSTFSLAEVQVEGKLFGHFCPNCVDEGILIPGDLREETLDSGIGMHATPSRVERAYVELAGKDVRVAQRTIEESD